MLTGLDCDIRYAFGIVDLGGFERSTPLLAGVSIEPGFRKGELYARRIEAGDHQSADVLELGARAVSYIDEAPRPSDYDDYSCPVCTMHDYDDAPLADLLEAPIRQDGRA